ncbi:MAG: phenylacetate--CoA ligase family protein [Betaproteobacteria bacterium]
MHDEQFRRQLAGLFQRSPFYRDKLRAAGFSSPAGIGLERIAELPFTEKDELRASQAAHPPLGAHLAVEMEDLARIYSTSGTSGVPLYIPLTRNDVDDWRAIGRATYSANGLRAGERVVTTYGAGPFVAGAALHAFEAIGVVHIPVGVGNTDRLLTAIERLRPQALACTPSFAMHIAETAASRGVGVSCVERIICGGEPGGGEEAFRGKLEAAYGCKVYEIMGIGDIAASLWGECPQQAGMHFSGEGIIHVELIDSESGAPVPLEDAGNEGAEGELVYTHLRREAAPLLRFRSRDHARVWASPCKCGRTSPRVRLFGRTDDMLIVRGVNVFPSAVREVVARFMPRVTGAILIRPRVRGVKQEPPLPVVVEGDASLAGDIGREIRSSLLFTAEVRMVAPRSLPRSDYKSRLVDFSGT